MGSSSSSSCYFEQKSLNFKQILCPNEQKVSVLYPVQQFDLSTANISKNGGFSKDGLSEKFIGGGRRGSSFCGPQTSKLTWLMFSERLFPRKRWWRAWRVAVFICVQYDGTLQSESLLPPRRCVCWNHTDSCSSLQAPLLMGTAGGNSFFLRENHPVYANAPHLHLKQTPYTYAQVRGLEKGRLRYHCWRMDSFPFTKLLWGGCKHSHGGSALQRRWDHRSGGSSAANTHLHRAHSVRQTHMCWSH